MLYYIAFHRRLRIRRRRVVFILRRPQRHARRSLYVYILLYCFTTAINVYDGIFLLSINEKI